MDFREATSCNNPTEWIAPTWSWATSNNQVWIQVTSRRHRGHKSRYFETEFVDLDVRTKLSGELTHASMRIKCRPMLAVVIPDSNPEISMYCYSFHLVLMKGDMHPSEAKLGGKGTHVTSTLYMDDSNFCGPKQAHVILIRRFFSQTTY